ncbi:MAG: hypothetical protein HYR85_04800 [Planctomycetes bacterium]|nr:hypothetical protein [Planctomycetota bacterium]MBI3844166.1 hypothetical protein [Planctomycetota bacterium]
MTSRSSRWLGSSLFAALFATMFTSAAFAQGFCQRDNLDGPCCQPTQVALPQFPSRSGDIRFICFDGCAPRIDRNLCVDFGAPQPAQQGGALVCGVYLIRVQVKTCGAAAQVLWSGTMRAHYARNWLEVDNNGRQLGVWRFLLNGDLVPSQFLLQQAGQNQCVVPRCYFQFQRVYFTGYFDYARDCQTGQWTTAGALNHDKDFIDHAGFTVRPAPAGGFHPTRSFDFVWPSAGFMTDPVNGPFSQGQVQPLQESFRKNNWPTVPNICLFEEPVGGGGINPINQYCPCSALPIAPLQYADTNVDVVGQCGSQVVPANGAPLPFIQKKIGFWSNPNAYPGIEYLRIDQGFLNHRDGCNPANLGNQWFEGVETLRGFQTMSYTGIVLGQQFEDWGSSNGVGGAVLIGAPHVTWFLTDFNMF